MPDQDEFAPLAAQWKPVHLLFCDRESPEKIADAAFRTLKQMLRECNGCPILPELLQYLTDFDNHVAIRAEIGWQLLGVPEECIDAKLDALSRAIDNRRIDAVAVRSCRIAAIRVAAKTFPTPISAAFATMLAQHLLCHFVLDRARAFAVGGLYTATTARATHQQVLDILEAPLYTFGERWAKDPSAQFRMNFGLVQKPGT